MLQQLELFELAFEVLHQKLSVSLYVGPAENLVDIKLARLLQDAEKVVAEAILADLLMQIFEPGLFKESLQAFLGYVFSCVA